MSPWGVGCRSTATPETVAAELGLDRIYLIEEEYRRAGAAAERAWLRRIVADLRNGALRWTPPQSRR